MAYVTNIELIIKEYIMVIKERKENQLKPFVGDTRRYLFSNVMPSFKRRHRYSILHWNTHFHSYWKKRKICNQYNTSRPPSGFNKYGQMGLRPIYPLNYSPYVRTQYRHWLSYMILTFPMGYHLILGVFLYRHVVPTHNFKLLYL